MKCVPIAGEICCAHTVCVALKEHWMLWLYLRITEHIYPCDFDSFDRNENSIIVFNAHFGLICKIARSRLLAEMCTLYTHGENRSRYISSYKRSRVKWTSVFSLRESQYAQYASNVRRFVCTGRRIPDFDLTNKFLFSFVAMLILFHFFIVVSLLLSLVKDIMWCTPLVKAPMCMWNPHCGCYQSSETIQIKESA